MRRFTSEVFRNRASAALPQSTIERRSSANALRVDSTKSLGERLTLSGRLASWSFKRGHSMNLVRTSQVIGQSSVGLTVWRACCQ